MEGRGKNPAPWPQDGPNPMAQLTSHITPWEQTVRQVQLNPHLCLVASRVLFYMPVPFPSPSITPLVNHMLKNSTSGSVAQEPVLRQVVSNPL